MKRKLLAFAIFLVLVACQKDDDELLPPSETLEPYIKNLVLPDTKPPYRGSYYIHVRFNQTGLEHTEELTFSEPTHNMSTWYTPSDAGLGMSVQGVHFRDAATNEELEVTFHFNNSTDHTFNICYANYVFSDPWRNVAGANVSYLTPVSPSDPHTKHLYLGINSSEYYFKISYIGSGRINGRFSTRWKECCGGDKTYLVEGDFSIPDIRYFPD